MHDKEMATYLGREFYFFVQAKKHLNDDDGGHSGNYDFDHNLQWELGINLLTFQWCLTINLLVQMYRIS